MENLLPRRGPGSGDRRVRERARRGGDGLPGRGEARPVSPRLSRETQVPARPRRTFTPARVSTQPPRFGRAARLAH